MNGPVMADRFHCGEQWGVRFLRYGERSAKQDSHYGGYRVSSGRATKAGVIHRLLNEAHAYRHRDHGTGALDGK